MDVDAIFKALSDPTRREILADLSRKEGQTLFEICVRLMSVKKIAMTRQAISKHLDSLEESGLIRTKWDGREKQHFLNRKNFRHIEDWLASLQLDI